MIILSPKSTPIASRIKNFSGNALLGTTPDTTILDTVIQEVKGKDLLSDGEVTETVPEFKFLDKLNIFTSCQIKACNKKMPYVLNCKVIACPSCGTSQRYASAKSWITARLCAEIMGKIYGSRFSTMSCKNCFSRSI